MKRHHVSRRPVIVTGVIHVMSWLGQSRIRPIGEIAEENAARTEICSL